MEIQERKKYIDILKGIGIFYVILGHVTHTSFLFRYIYSFHMPLFFFISGMLFVPSKHVSTSGYIKKKANSLLIPYIFFYLVSLLYWYFVEYRIFGRDGDTTFLNELYRIFHGTGSIAAGTLWFLPCLFCVEVLYCFMHDEHHKYAGGIYSVIVFIIGSVCIHYHFCPQILGLLQALVVMPVFAAGYYLRDKIDAIIASPLKMKVAIMCIALVVQYLLLDYSILNILSSSFCRHCFLSDAITHHPEELLFGMDRKEQLVYFCFSWPDISWHNNNPFHFFERFIVRVA